MGAALLICALSISYYFVIFLPKSKTEQLKIQEERNKAEIDLKNKEIEHSNSLIESRSACMNKADEDKINLWNRTCHNLGKEDMCFLPNDSAKYIQDLVQRAKDNCIKLTTE